MSSLVSAVGASPLTRDLNPQQEAAVLAEGGPVLVLAGAGTGKTGVLTRRIAHLIQSGVPRERILATTFTNKAAEEMGDRVASLLQPEPPELAGMYLGTFHSLCLRLLRTHEAFGVGAGFSVYTEEDRELVVAAAIARLGLSTELTTREATAYISGVKNGVLGADRPLPEKVLRKLPALRQVEAEYLEALRASYALDFDDLLLTVRDGLEAHPGLLQHLQAQFDHVLVDEFQDTNTVQYRIVRLLAAPQDHLFVVGDEHQSIYRFRGARIDHILGFMEDYPAATQIRLERNYRSNGVILEAANAVIAHNTRGYHKQLWTDREPGPPIPVVRCASPIREAEWIARALGRLQPQYDLDDMAVLYRLNTQGDALEQVFRPRGIPYVRVGKSRPFDDPWTRPVLHLIRLALNPLDEVSLEAVLALPCLDVPADTLVELQQSAEGPGGLGRAVSSCDPAGISRPWAALRRALAQIERDRAVSDAAEDLRLLLEASGYAEYVRQEGDRTGRTALEQILEEAQRYGLDQREADPSLGAYADHLSLSTLDPDRQGQGVSLLTIHAAKGMEFPVVFVVGMEEGVFPGVRTLEQSLFETDALEEERRLFYVALTRARKVLVLTHASERATIGGQAPSTPSRFLAELPPAHVKPLTLG